MLHSSEKSQSYLGPGDVERLDIRLIPCFGGIWGCGVEVSRKSKLNASIPIVDKVYSLSQRGPAINETDFGMKRFFLTTNNIREKY